MNKRTALPQFASEFALTAVARSSDELMDAARRIDEGADDPVRAVHELRVAIRRVRADLRIFERVFDPIWLEATKQQLRDLADVVGEARDLDVIVGRLEQLAGALPESDHPYAEAVLTQLRQDRGAALQRTLAALGDRDRASVIQDLAVIEVRWPLAADADRVAIEDLVEAARRQWRRLRKSVRSAKALPSAENLHKVRVRAKTLRYSLERLDPLLHKSARRHAKRLAALQDHLGEMHDAVVTERWLREFRETGRGDVFLIGELVGIERAREEWFRATWRYRWKRASRGARAPLDTLIHPARHNVRLPFIEGSAAGCAPASLVAYRPVEVGMAITELEPTLRAERQVDLAVVATPVGPLAHAIDAYRQAVAVRFGTNTAHRDEAHCSLVRSYRDHPSSVDAYQHALFATLTEDLRHRTVVVTELSTADKWHGLEIESPALFALAIGFATRASAAGGRSVVTRQDRMRLTLAAEVDVADRDAMSELAHRIVDPALPAEWQVGLWQSSGDAWECVWRERTR